MSNASLSREDAEQIVGLANELLKAGYAPPHVKSRSIPKMYEQLGNAFEEANGYRLTDAGLRARVRTAKLDFGLEPDWSLWNSKPVRRGETVSAEIELPKTISIGPRLVEPVPKDPPDHIIRELIRKKAKSLEEMSNEAGVPVGEVLDVIENLREAGVNIHRSGDTYQIEKTPAPRESGQEPQFEMVSDDNNIFQFGVVTDNHLGSKYERLDVLEDMYDRFERRGITRVYNAGNWIDGEHRFNKFDLKIHGMNQQLRYFAEKYPQRDGIETYAVAGDDHEGWYVQREGVDIGKYAESKMREAGRSDWHYMGYMEADVKLVNANTGAHAIMRVVHPGGGSSYAISYSIQKLVESYEGGDKPAVVIAGHYHKLDLFNYRNVWCIQGGCTEDQTTFMRKKKIDAHIGGLIVTLEQDPATAAIVMCNDMYRYFNREYYALNRYEMSGPVNLKPRTLGGV